MDRIYGTSLETWKHAKREQSSKLDVDGTTARGTSGWRKCMIWDGMGMVVVKVEVYGDQDGWSRSMVKIGANGA